LDAYQSESISFKKQMNRYTSHACETVLSAALFNCI